MKKTKDFENKAIKNLIIVLVLVFFGAMIYFALTLKNSNLSDQTNVKEQPAPAVEEKELDESEKMINEAMKAEVAAVRPIDETDHYQGSLDAPVQLIVYSDFECPFCATFSQTLETITEEFGDQVVIAVRHYTLRSHPNAVPAAVASECAADQGKFWEMHEKLYEDNRDAAMGMEEYKKNARELDLDTELFNECLDKFRHRQKIAAQLQEGRDAGVAGTPGAFVNGEPVPGAYPFEDFIGSDNRPSQGMRSIIQRHLGQENK